MYRQNYRRPDDTSDYVMELYVLKSLLCSLYNQNCLEIILELWTHNITNTVLNL